MKSQIPWSRNSYWSIGLGAALLTIGLASPRILNAQANEEFAPLVKVRHEDYAKARKDFHTKLLREGPSPQPWTPVTPPTGVKEVEYQSGNLRLKAWVNLPADKR